MFEAPRKILVNYNSTIPVVISKVLKSLKINLKNAKIYAKID